jgi:hypothetical protein
VTVRPAHLSRTRVMSNLDSISRGVYVELNLIEARAAAILTPHLTRHAPALFLGVFSRAVSWTG